MRPLEGFYSQLEHAVEQKMKGPVAPSQLLAMLRKPESGVKQDELKWSGLDDFLANRKEPVTKKTVQDFLKANNVQVEEIVHGKEVDRARIANLQSQLTQAVEEAKAAEQTGFKAGDRVASVGNGPSKGGYAYSEGRIYEAQPNGLGLLTWKKAGTFGGTRAGRSEKFVKELKEQAEYPWLSSATHNGLVANSQAAQAAESKVERIQYELEKAREGSGEPTKFKQWKTPGGQNYRELLLTLPGDPTRRT